MAKEELTTPPFAEGTDEYLEEAKQGKVRYFLLVCKGTQVTYLAVNKKPIKQGVLLDARKSGFKGDGYFGVISGKGMDLTFNLATADGYDAEPVKPKILKDFLIEQAGFKCAPTFAIVNEAPEVPFDTADLNHPLVAKFEKLKPIVEKAIAARADLAQEIRKRVAEVRELLLDKQTRDGAAGQVDQLVDYLKTLLVPQNDAGNSGNAGGNNAGTTTVDPLQERLAKFEKTLEAAKKRYADKAEAWDKLFNYAKQQAAAGSTASATKALDGLEQAIRGAAQGQTATGQGTTGQDASAQKPIGQDALNAWKSAKTGWDEANEAVDKQLEALIKALRSSGDEDFEEIAELGLSGVTGNLRVPLTAALMDVERAGNTPQAAMKKAKPLVQSYRSFLETDDKIAMVDDNPMNVTVSIRTTLVEALTQLEAAMVAAGA